MMRILFFPLIVVILAACSPSQSSESDDFQLTVYQPLDVEKTNETKVYVNYLPWYESVQEDGYWGKHWTMDTRNPDVITDGRREIASHFYPLIGPYGSSDPDLIEYHLLLMKLSGIDGVLVDWHGIHDVHDYIDNLRNANRFIRETDDVKLDFGIIYKDQTTKEVVLDGKANSAVNAAVNDFNYIRHAYFSRPNYIRISNQYMLMVYTPEHIERESQWRQVLEGSTMNPLFLSIWGESDDLGSTGGGEYSWLYNGENNHLGKLSSFYMGDTTQFRLGSAYAGFRDYYQEGGWVDSTDWEIAHNQTQTLSETLDLATQNEASHIQLLTWNNFGEGTMLEPTQEFGYSFLEKIQEFTGVTYTVEDLEYVTKLYHLRKKYPNESLEKQKLDQAFYYFISLQADKAKNLLDEFGAS